MPAAKRQKTRAEELAGLVTGPYSKEFDPEEDIPEVAEHGSEVEEDGINDFDGREHYEQVSKSRLRRKQETALGPQYVGSKVKRKRLGDEDGVLHDPFAGYSDEVSSNEVDELSDEDDIDRGSHDNINPGIDEDGPDIEDMRSESEEELDDDDQDMDLEDFALDADIRQKKDNTKDRDELKRILAAEQQGLASTLAESQRADAVKGVAVKRQRKTFSSLLHSRVRLQKGLDAFNGLTPENSGHQSEEMQAAAQAAELAARKLWTTLDSLRCTLADARASAPQIGRCDASAPIEDLWSHMLSLEDATRPHRRATLEKWSKRTQKASVTAARTASNKLNLNGSGARTSLLDVLDAQLADPERLVRRTKKSEDTLDDPDFYNLVLKDLVDHRDANLPTDISSRNPRLAPDGAKPSVASGQKGGAHTRASKGRQMRYTVHEKLLNFMVPDDKGSWSEKAAGELFGSLFGAKMANGLVNGAIDADAEGHEEEALRLFRG